MFPIEQVEGTHGPVWVVWSMRAEDCSFRSAKGLEGFVSYAAGEAECARRNLALAEERGHADADMSGAQYSYRQYYEAVIGGDA